MRSLLFAVASFTILAGCGAGVEYIEESRQATGIKIGEVTPSSAIVWTRVPESASRRAAGVAIRARSTKPEPRETVEQLDPRDLQNSVPGGPGRVRLRYADNVNFFNPVESKWFAVDAADDYTHHFKLSGLKPATV